MHIVFENREKYNEYAASKTHEEFITVTAGCLQGVAYWTAISSEL